MRIHQNIKGNMKRFFLSILAAGCLASPVHAQSNATGPLVTRAGALTFVREDHGFSGMLDNQVFDRFQAKALTHFDEVDDKGDAVMRSLVQTDAGPVLYDFRARPPLVQRAGRRMTIKRVFWQGDEVVMQSTQGWFRLARGVLTKLQSSKSTYH
jgi:hypothetical protein